MQVYKILHDIDKVDKSKIFRLAEYYATCGSSFKFLNVGQDYNTRI